MFVDDGRKETYLFSTIDEALFAIKNFKAYFIDQHPNGFYQILDQDFKIVHSTKTEIKQLSMFGGDHG
jgi:hypothetical protein